MDRKASLAKARAAKLEKSMARRRAAFTEDTEDTNTQPPLAPMPGTRRELVKELHDLVGQRLLTMLRDPSKVIRGSTLGVMTQFLKLSVDALPKDPPTVAEGNAAVLRDLKGRKLHMFTDEPPAVEADPRLSTPFTDDF
jgi:hypothetical protein